jgi:hypothetical protein
MGAAVTAFSLSSGRLPRRYRCTSQRSLFVISSAAPFPGSGVGDGIVARRASHTTHDIVTSQNGTRSPPLWRSRETVDVQSAHTGEEATDTQYIHPITRFPWIFVIGSRSIILTTLKWQEVNEPESLAISSLPVGHRRRLRASQQRERLNEGIERRTRAQDLFPNEASALRLVVARSPASPRRGRTAA